MSSEYQSIKETLMNLIEPSLFNSIDSNPFSLIKSDYSDSFQGKLLVQKDPNDDSITENYFELSSNYLICYESQSKDKINYLINFNDIWKFYYDIEIYLDEDGESSDDDQTNFLFLRSKEEMHLFYCPDLTKYRLWIEKLRSKCILTNFTNFYSQKQENSNLKGNFFLFANKLSQQDSVVKIFSLKQLKSLPNNQLLISLRNEILILKNLKHSNIIQLKEIYEGKTNLYFVYERLSGPSLSGINPLSLKSSEIELVMKQKDALKNALDYLHSKGISHKNVQPACLIFKEHDFSSPIVLSNFLVEEQDENFLNADSDYENLERCFEQIKEKLNCTNCIRE